MSRSRIISILALATILIADCILDGQERPIRTDIAGDPLPDGAISRIGTIRYRVRGWHQQVFFSADGDTVIAKGEESVLKLFDVETGKILAEIKVHDLTNWSADLSPDGKFLAVFGADRRGKPAPDTTFRLYDPKTRKPVWEKVDSEASPKGQPQVQFTGDGKRLVTLSQDVRVWDAKSGDELIRQKNTGSND
jgi:WD40 repeat protein